MNEKQLKRLPSGGIEYKNKEFSGVNIPRCSTRKNKSLMVIAKKGQELKIVHFGTEVKPIPSSKTISRVKAGRKGYLTRSVNIRTKDGKLSKNDKFSANYWSRKYT